MNETDFLSSFLFSVSVTLPNIIILLIGVVLNRRRVVDGKFCEQGARVVFNITLPLLLFFNTFESDVAFGSQLTMVSVGLFGTLILYAAGEWFAARYVENKRERCILVQAVFRGNNGILGLAFCINAYGDAAFAPASIYSAALVLLYNVLAVITITKSLSEQRVNVARLFKGIVKNPLIIAIVLGIGCNLLQVKLPPSLAVTGHTIANATLPLALICAGATIDLKALNQTSSVSLWGSIARIGVAPVVMVLLAKAFGLNHMEMGIVLLMTATPLASAAYAMVRGMGGNATAVANIIGITTISSMFVSALWLIFLSQIGWI